MNHLKEKLLFFVGVVLTVVGVFVNEVVLTRWFSADGTLATQSRLLILTFNIFCIVSGLLIIQYRRFISQYIVFSWRGFLYVAIYGVIMLGGLELAARVLDAAQDNRFTAEREKTDAVVPFRIFGPEYYTYDTADTLTITSRHDEQFPHQKGSSTIRIVVFGGSTTEQKLANGDHYPLLMQQELRAMHPEKNIEVINVANSAYSSAHSLVTLSLDVLSWDPDIVILSHNVNDLTAAYFPEFQFDYGHKYRNDFYVPASLRRESTVSLLDWSSLYWMLKVSTRRFTARMPSADSTYIRASYGEAPPAWAQDTFTRNINSFVDLATANDVTVVLGTQPHQPDQSYFDNSYRWKSYNDVVVYPEHSEYVAHHAAFNQLLRTVAEKKDVHLVDNATSFAGESKYFIDNVHYTEAGVAQLAENFTQYITSAGLLKN